MYCYKNWRMIFLGATCLGTLGLVGCPTSYTIAQYSQEQADVTPVVQNNSSVSAASGDTARPVSFEVCAELTEWQRPDPAAHLTALRENPRYGDSLNEEPLKSLYEKFWNESIFTFTTYGLSARTEPVLLSGVGTAIEEMESCYEGDRPTSINEGSLAEMWLIGYTVTDVLWTGSLYQVTVEPTETGLQFVQFERFDSESMLPVQVIQSDGDEIAVASGDW